MGSRVCVTAFFFVLAAGCGAKTELLPTVDGEVEKPPSFQAERCNGLDDDGDALVDEPFRDGDGHYLADEHCGGCGRPCGPSGDRVVEARCSMIDGSPLCAATRCVEGFVPTRSGRCVRAHSLLCLPCVDDDDCGDVAGARCMDLGAERRCAEPCLSGACPAGYACDAAEELCVPSGGSCSCEADGSFDLACAIPSPSGTFCAGDARCSSGTLSACVAPVEVCNEADDDCDGTVDEDFRDVRGAYTVDIRNCGACGVDCTVSPLPVGSLVCGGDVFAPSCVLDCPDTHDGIEPGDHVDADRDLATGCECIVRSSIDAPGPRLAQGDALDVNCDGADGIVVESYYVATDGDDSGPGSPTRPLRTLSEAMRRVSENVASGSQRTNVFVAGGSYAEVVELPDGAQLYGGYRRDFLALDPNGFVTEVRAPATAASPGGAALVVDGAGGRTTRASWIRFVGVDASTPGTPAIGAYLRDVGPSLFLEGLEVRGGVPAIGSNGQRGPSGSSPSSAAGVGAAPRGAVEDSAHRCIASSANVVRGGAGGINVCAGDDVSGGAGASTHCPTFGSNAAAGQPGQGSATATFGAGGRGGQDSSAPVVGAACPDAPVCCGLADFTVPTEFVTPGPGGNGANGVAGAPGEGCVDSIGRFSMGMWRMGLASDGSSGSPGGGGGGGGAGGGTEFEWMAGLCAFADGLGGGGGGGGAGGCGGVFGTGGTSGAPSIAILIERSVSVAPFPTIRDCVLRTNDGGRGGDGGAGGDGGFGGVGAIGEEIPRSQRTTPTLAGPFAGGRGGRGGDGGPGGAGGGGCGGSSIGILSSGAGGGGPPPSAYRSDNVFVLGRGGPAGRGGGGSGSDGAEGVSVDVLSR